MAKKIQLKRGGLGNIDAVTGSLSLAEPIVATGSLNNLVGPSLLVGDGTSAAVVNILRDGATTPTVDTDALDGIPFYNSTDKDLWILKQAGNLEVTFTTSSIDSFNTEVSRSAAAAGFGSGEAASSSSFASRITTIEGNYITTGSDGTQQDIKGDLRIIGDIIAENYVVSSSVTQITYQAISGSTIFGDTTDDTHQFTGSVSITGSFNVNNGTATFQENVIVNGNTTLGNAATDTVTFTADVASNILPDGDDTRTLGDASNRWQLYGVNSSISGSFSGSFAGDGTNLTGITSNAAGNDTEVQFNDGGTTLAGDPQFTWNKTDNQLTVTGGITGSFVQVGNLTTTNGIVFADANGGLLDDSQLTYTSATQLITATASWGKEAVTASYVDGGTF